MAKRIKNTHGAGVYATFLTIYILVLALISVFGLTRLWEYAKTLDPVGPESTMDAYIEQLKDNVWNEGMAQTVSAMPHEFQSDEECVQIVKDMLEAPAWSST